MLGLGASTSRIVYSPPTKEALVRRREHVCLGLWMLSRAHLVTHRHGGLEARQCSGARWLILLPCMNWAGAAGGDDAQVSGAHAAAGAEEEVLVGTITGLGDWRTRR